MPKTPGKPSEFLQKYYEVIDQHITEEKWKPIYLGEKPLYEVSTLGRVRSIMTKHVLIPFHSYRKDKHGNYITCRPTYLRVHLFYYINGIRRAKNFEISRLVASAFIPVPRKYIEQGYDDRTLQVNHIRGGYEIYDNTIYNLEWCTADENISMAFQTGLRHPPKGESHHSTFIDECIVRKICEDISNKVSVLKSYDHLKDQLADGITYYQFRSCYYSIKYRKSWVFISHEYDF